jgi:hypothetical protein
MFPSRLSLMEVRKFPAAILPAKSSVEELYKKGFGFCAPAGVELLYAGD